MARSSYNRGWKDLGSLIGGIIIGIYLGYALLQLPGLLKDLNEWILSKYSHRHHFRSKFLLKWKWLCHGIGGSDYVDTSHPHSSSSIATSNSNYDSQQLMFITSRTKVREKDNHLAEQIKSEIQVEVQKEVKTLRLAINCIHEELLKMQLLINDINVETYSLSITD